MEKFGSNNYPFVLGFTARHSNILAALFLGDSVVELTYYMMDP